MTDGRGMSAGPGRDEPNSLTLLRDSCLLRAAVGSGCESPSDTSVLNGAVPKPYFVQGDVEPGDASQLDFEVIRVYLDLGDELVEQDAPLVVCGRFPQSIPVEIGEHGDDALELFGQVVGGGVVRLLDLVECYELCADSLLFVVEPVGGDLVGRHHSSKMNGT